MKIAAVQQPPVYMDKEASLARAVELIGEAAAGGCRMAVFPETWLPGILPSSGAFLPARE